MKEEGLVSLLKAIYEGIERTSAESRHTIEEIDAVLATSSAEKRDGHRPTEIARASGPRFGDRKN